MPLASAVAIRFNLEFTIMSSTPFSVLSAAALAAAFWAFPAPAQAQVPLLITDGSWLVSASAPAAANWNSALAFDDSSWASATVLFNLAPFGGGYVADAIWSSGQFSSNTEVWGRSVLNLAQLPTSAMLAGGFDDDGDVYVNGHLVASNHDGVAGNFAPVDISSYLTIGDNLFAFSANDNAQVFGFNHQVWLQVDGETQHVPEPSSIALVLLALGLCFAPRGGGVRR